MGGLATRGAPIAQGPEGSSNRNGCGPCFFSVAFCPVCSVAASFGCGGARRVVHQFEFLAAAVAAAAAAASTAVRHVSPVPHSPRRSEASYALNLGRSFVLLVVGREALLGRGGPWFGVFVVIFWLLLWRLPLLPQPPFARANASDH